MMRQTASKSSERRRGIDESDARASASISINLSAGSGGGNGRPLLLGHRGARPGSRYGPSSDAAHVPAESTLACFEYALANGCDGFEFDVRLTRDRRLVLCHNAWLRGCKVSTSLFETLLSRSGVALARLEDVLQAFGERAYLDIEVKVPGAEELIVTAIHDCPPGCGYLVSSFLPGVLRRLHELDPKLPLGYVCDRPYSISLWRTVPIEAFLPQHKLITHALVDQVHERGLRIFTWTVNSEEELHRLATCGVDGVISDDPRLLNRTLQSACASGERRTAKSE
jgi:glycerophosphoryl diester phosphodiesterase